MGIEFFLPPNPAEPGPSSLPPSPPLRGRGAGGEGADRPTPQRHTRKRSDRLKPVARKLRREITPAEAILWRHLRGRRFAGIKFRRQCVVGPYIVDFYCAEHALVIEL